MSEKPPAPRDRTPLYIAIVGATATIMAALIGVLPNLTRQNSPPPTPIVITATPAPTEVAQATLAPATQTDISGFPTLTLIPPTATLAATVIPTTISPTISSGAEITLLLINNLPRAMDFSIDGASVTAIESGTYKALPVRRGPHEFKQCVFGADPSLPENCFSRTALVVNQPEFWEMFDNANPIPVSGDVILLVLNQAPTPQDLYLDGELAETVPAHGYAAIAVAPGKHTLQPCALQRTPESGTCGARSEFDLQKKIESFTIQSEAS
jgi:hypothetical protein